MAIVVRGKATKQPSWELCGINVATHTRLLLSKPTETHTWDVVIVGGGPAGIAAGLQLARAGRRTTLVERAMVGGQARRLDHIENLPGWPKGVSGRGVMRLWERQARRWGLGTVTGDAVSVRKSEGAFKVRLADGRCLSAGAVVLAPGACFKTLGVPGERRLFGKGVTHGAFDDAPRWSHRVVAVVGGGETAVHQAIHLARWARRVELIARGPLRAHDLLLRRLRDCANVSVQSGRVVRILGKNKVCAVVVRQDGQDRRLGVSAVFVLIGAQASAWVRRSVRPGVFVAGDARGAIERQVAVAAGDGMAAAVRAMRWLQEQR